MRWFPFQWWEWGGSKVKASTLLPPLSAEMGLNPISAVGEGWKSLHLASTPLPPLKLESPFIWGVSHVHGGQRPISLECQINHPTYHIWYSSNWNGWRRLHQLQIWPPDGVTCIATLHDIDLLPPSLDIGIFINQGLLLICIILEACNNIKFT